MSSSHLLWTGPGPSLRWQNPPSLCATEVFLAVGWDWIYTNSPGNSKNCCLTRTNLISYTLGCVEKSAGDLSRTSVESKERKDRKGELILRPWQERAPGSDKQMRNSWEERPSLLSESPSCFACCYGKITPGKQLTRGRFSSSHGSRWQPAILGKPQSQKPEVGGHTASRVKKQVTSVS